MDKLTANFFWIGDNFQFLNRLTILSHLVVGHKVVIWLSGRTPYSKYWIDDIEEVKIKDADKILNVDKFIRLGGNVRTASDLFSFILMYRHGGLYCDTDMIALREFPDDEWILATYTDELVQGYETIGIGIIKAPKGHAVFKKCISEVNYDWGNVVVFSRYCAKHGLKKTHPNKMFYPWGCKSGHKLLHNIDVSKSHGLHFYFLSASELAIDQDVISQYPESVAFRVAKKVFKDYPYDKSKA